MSLPLNAPHDFEPRRDPERDRRELELRRNAPKRATVPQDDAGHLPLFVAGNEPRLI